MSRISIVTVLLAANEALTGDFVTEGSGKHYPNQCALSVWVDGLIADPFDVSKKVPGLQTADRIIGVRYPTGVRGIQTGTSEGLLIDDFHPLEQIQFVIDYERNLKFIVKNC